MVTIGAIILGIMFEGGAFGDSGPDFEDGAFESADATRLVQRLDAASKAQGICYGWEIDTDRMFSRPTALLPTMLPTTLPTAVPSAPSTAPPSGPPPSQAPAPAPTPPVRTGLGIDAGSNLGVGVDPRQVPTSCPKWVVFSATYDWALIDEVQKLESFGVESNVQQPPTVADLNAAGITEAALKKEDAPARLADAVAALPMIMSEKAGADPVPQPTAAAPAPGDTVQNDFPTALVIGGLMVAGGLVWILIAFVRSRRRRPNNLEGLTDVR